MHAPYLFIIGVCVHQGLPLFQAVETSRDWFFFVKTSHNISEEDIVLRQKGRLLGLGLWQICHCLNHSETDL